MAQTKDLVLFGTGDFAKLAHLAFSTAGKYRVIGFTVDDKHHQYREFLGLPVWPYSEFVQKVRPSQAEVFVAIGYTRMSQLRQQKCIELKAAGYTLASHVSPQAIVETESLGEHVFIFEGVTIQPFVKVGDDVVIWTGATICHDSVIGDHSFIGPRAAVSGHVRIGANCFVGLNATIKDHVTLAEQTLVGAGALIVKDTEFQSVWVSPAAEATGKKSPDISRI